MTSVTTEPPTLRSVPSIAVTSSSAGVTASQRRSYSCYNCNYSFHITPTTTTTSTSSPSSFRCPRCHHRHLIPHHTISPPLPPPAPPVILPRNPDYAPASSSFFYQTSDDSDSDDDDYDSDNSLLSFTTPDFHPSTPASKSIVGSLPIKIFPPNSTPSLQSCSICMEDFEVNSGTSVTVNELPCEHYFHKECIVEWLQRSNTCPLCRYKLPADPSPEERIDPGTNHREVEYDAVLVVDLAPTREPMGGRADIEESLSSNANAAGSGSGSGSGSDRGGLSVNGGEISNWDFDAMRDEDGDTLMIDA